MEGRPVSGRLSVRATYHANRLTSVTDWNMTTIDYAYDDAGRMTTATLPSGTGIVSTYSYDDADRLTGITHVKGGSTTLASVAYTLDQVGNRTQRVDQQGTHTYAYDDLYRLTSVVYPGPSTTSYAFDAFGNRTSMTVAGNTTSYAYDDNDRITSVTPPSPASVINYTWDDNGDLTARGSDSFSWDYEDRMVSATVNSVTTNFVYRGDGLRDSRSVSGGATTTFTWDIAGGLPVVLDDGNQYLYGAGLTAQKQSGSWYYYLADGLGSTMAVVNASGVVQDSYTYDVYGVPTKTGSLANEFDFAGQQTDGTGLQYLRARYYDPATGAFLSRDPMAALPGSTGSSTAYGSSNPPSRTDPTGLIATDSDGCANDDAGCHDRVVTDEWSSRKVQYCGTFPNGYFVRSWQGCPLSPTEHEAKILDLPLLGEYVVNAIGNGLEVWGNSALDRAEFFESLGPKFRACAALEGCATAVALAIHLLGIPAALIGPEAVVAMQAVGFAWDTYAIKVQWEESQKPETSLAAP